MRIEKLNSTTTRICVNNTEAGVFYLVHKGKNAYYKLFKAGEVLGLVASKKEALDLAVALAV